MENMYRTYENPYELENRLKAVIAERDRFKASGKLDIEEEYYYELVIAELRDRINFAWQDDEEE